MVNSFATNILSKINPNPKPVVMGWDFFRLKLKNSEQAGFSPIQGVLILQIKNLSVFCPLCVEAKKDAVIL